jgi:uncharacterized protein YggU (UPF0235/DUF167 family)
MRLTIHAKPRSKKNEVIVDSQNSSILTIFTTQPADKNRANEAILKLLASHLGIASSKLTLISGRTSRIKIVDIDD